MHLLLGYCFLLGKVKRLKDSILLLTQLGGLQRGRNVSETIQPQCSSVLGKTQATGAIITTNALPKTLQTQGRGMCQGRPSTG